VPGREDDRQILAGRPFLVWKLEDFHQSYGDQRSIAQDAVPDDEHCILGLLAQLDPIAGYELRSATIGNTDLRLPSRAPSKGSAGLFSDGSIRFYTNRSTRSIPTNEAGEEPYTQGCYGA
jgi:hypothetical protein